MRKTHTDSYLDFIIRNKKIANSMFKDSHRLYRTQNVFSC